VTRSTAGAALGSAGPSDPIGPLDGGGPGGAGGSGARPAGPLAAREVPVGQLAPDPDQPRRRYSEERLACLAASVRAYGVIQPLLVAPHPDPAARADTPYQIIVGERRWHAARRAGLATVPAVLREQRLAPADRLMMQIAESDGEHREELALFDLATAVARAFELARCTQVQFAQRHRRSQAWLSNLLHLAHSQGLAREALAEGLLQGILAARTYLRLTVGQQRNLLAEARESRLPITLRRAEKAAAETEDRRRQRHRRAVDGAGGGGAEEGGTGGGGTAGGTADGEDEADGADGGAATGDGPGLRRQEQNGAAAEAGAAAAPVARAAAPSDFAAARARAVAARTAGAGAGVAASRTTPLAVAPPAVPFPVPGASGPRSGGPWITLELTVAQLETLLILLGQEPAGTPRDLVAQLLACL
jgi:ParB family chromosome partitioning protein